MVSRTDACHACRMSRSDSSKAARGGDKTSPDVASGGSSAKTQPSQADVRKRAATRAQRTAATAAKRAKASKATGSMRGHRGAKRLLRDSAIVARVQAGVPTSTVAAEFEVTQRTVQRVVERFDAAPTLLDARPMEIIERMLRRWQRMIADFEGLAYRYADSNPTAALGAKKAAADAANELTRLLVQVGKMPENLEYFRTTAEVRHLMRGLMLRLDRLEDGEITGAEVADYVRDIVLDVRPVYDENDGDEWSRDPQS